jgi:hypothetical protein
VKEADTSRPRRVLAIPGRSIFDFITMLAVVAGVLYGAIELRQFRQAREREATFELVRMIQTAEHSRAIALLVSLPDTITAAQLLALPKQDADLLYQLFATWESLGILVYRGEVSLDLVDDFYGGPILFSWQRLKPLVVHNRALFRRESVNEWFQWLVERLQARYQGQAELPPAHKAYRDWKPPK